MSARDLGTARIPSLADYGRERLDALCDALSLPGTERRSAQAVFQLVSDSWGQLPLDDEPAWENDLTDDGTPFEFSLGFEAEKPELRLLFESQLGAGRLSQHTSWQAGIALQAQLQARHLCVSTQFDKLLPLLMPRADYVPRFALWHAIVLSEAGASLCKVYLNPEIAGIAESRELAAEAFDRMGLSKAWRFVKRRLAKDTRLPYLSLDLKAPQVARTKLYLTAADAAGVERLVEGTPGLERGDALGWLQQLTQSVGPFSRRPILTCYAFRPGKAQPEATVHVPIRDYASNDQEALERTLELLPARSGRLLDQAMNALAHGPLKHSSGLLSYVSLRVVEGRLRVTTYLAPGAYSGGDSVDRRGSGTIPTGRPLASTSGLEG